MKYHFIVIIIYISDCLFIVYINFHDKKITRNILISLYHSFIHLCYRLIDYRKKGITTLQGVEIYESLKTENQEVVKELKAFQSNSQFNWKNVEDAHSVKKVPTNAPLKRSQYRPLDIVGMPGFEKLLPQEQDLCSKVRLVPQTYIELRDLLVSENKKAGFLRLQTARKMLKIDVNKTRKLYDFLVEEGYVCKPPS